MHRGDLQQVLYEFAVKRGITLRFDCRVVALDDDSETLTVIIKDGKRIEADIVVGADGKSTTNPS